jgi:hypothetical protein
MIEKWKGGSNKETKKHGRRRETKKRNVSYEQLCRCAVFSSKISFRLVIHISASANFIAFNVRSK